MIDLIITYSFYLLFFLTPLFWTSLNYELFEYNKMILTYGFTVVIVGAWVLKMIEQKTLIFKRTPLDIPLLLFLTANILSTIFSIDFHTSVWGYYSRSNGGLLSIISYLLLYFAFVSNFPKEKINTLLKFGLASGFIISLWAVMEHFGVSPSCIILRQEFNASCWVQDVQARVFATLGQPNWLAAYLAMLIFPAIYLLLTSESVKQKALYIVSIITMYLAFTFTYSRGPTLGLMAGLIVLITLSFLRKQESIKINRPQISKAFLSLTRNVKFGVTVLISFLIINLLFGSALTTFRLISKFAAPTRPSISLPTTPSGTQLENGGTESGQIRFIVWKGALDIFKHFPIFGSGLETFAYSYYQFRPASHNLTSEWDFLYNKAHNEYLNYLATTGVVGLGTYMLVILTFVVWCIKHIVYREHKNKAAHHTLYTILIPCLLASYISYLIYNFFLFSVVIIAIFFYLFPAIVFVATESLKVYRLQVAGFSFIYRKPLYTKVAKGLVILTTLYLLYSIFQIWYADTVFNQGQRASDSGTAGKAYNLLALATDLNPNEPLYRSELAYSAAVAASALKDSDATLSAALKDESLNQLSRVLKSSPKNTSFWRSAVRTYFALSDLDKKYLDSTLESLDTAILLAPTDPKLYYNKALILATENKKEEEVQNLKKALDLKLNYLDAIEQLKEATVSAK